SRCGRSCAGGWTRTGRRWPGTVSPRTRCWSNGTRRHAGCCGARRAICAPPTRRCCATSRRRPNCSPRRPGSRTRPVPGAGCPTAGRGRARERRGGGVVSEARSEGRGTCQRPDCVGTYEDVGGGELYCDTCGLAPVVSPTGSVASPPTGVTVGGRDSRGSSGSGRSARTSSQSSRSRRSVSGRLSRSLSGASSGRSVSVRSSGSGAGSTGRGRLGAGLVEVPPIPRPDPRAMVLDRAQVPERKRFCSRSDCGAPVGRARGERPGRTEGFCTKCCHPYSFVPKLSAGDVVHGQYEVVGCRAHGGLGWIYLAVDRAVSDRWVVLKGLLDTGDQDAMAAAISERRFLAEIE